jgi:tRNA A37 threonylcarbamoyladenosine biosynthesis protein TsaE
MFDMPAVTIIEWADRFPKLLPNNTLFLHIESPSESTQRTIHLRAQGKRAMAMLHELIHHWS